MKLLNYKLIYLGFIINALIIVLVALAAFRHFQSNNETLRVTKDRMEFSNELRRLSSLVSRQENELKNYIVLKDEKYISRLNKLDYLTTKCLAHLNFLQLIDQDRLKKLKELENVIAERSEFNSRLIESVKYSGPKATDSIIKHSEKYFLADRSHELIDELAKSVEVYLDGLSQRNESKKKLYRQVFVISLTICTILLMVVLYMLQYYLKTKIESEKRLEEALKELQQSEEQISMLLENIGDGVIGTDKNQIITYMNPVAERLTGWNKNEARGERIEKVFSIVNAETRGRVENPLSKAIEEKRVINLDRGTILIRKDNSELIIDDSGSPVLNKDGEVTGAVLIFRDVTEEKEAEHAVEEANRRFEKIFNFTPVSIIISDREDGRFIFVNEVFCKLIGYTQEEIIGKRSTDLNMLSVDHRNYLLEQIRAGGGKAKDVEISLRRKDGDFVNVRYSVETIEISGKPCLAIAMVDVTENKNAELRTAMILENIGEGVVVASPNQRVLLSNHVADEILGIDDSRASAEWADSFDIFYPDGRTIFPSQNLPLERALRGEEVHDLEIILQDRETKKRKLLRVSGTPIVNEDKRLLAAVATIKDITKLRATEKALKETEMKYRKLIGFDRDK